MNRSELESKHLAELHALAAEAGVPSYRKLSRSELIAKLADGDGGSAAPPSREGGRRGRPREEGRREERPREQRPRERRERRPRERDRDRERKRDEAPKPEPQTAPATTPPPARGKRKRRRRFRRRRKELRLHELLLASGGRQAIVYGESREGCTALLRELAAGVARTSKDLDPVAVLVDPSPEELADWRRDAPQAEIVAASQARHVEDALAQAANRAGAGEVVVVLLDSLSRFVEAYGDAEAAEELFEPAGGSLTLVAALERSA